MSTNTISPMFSAKLNNNQEMQSNSTSAQIQAPAIQKGSDTVELSNSGKLSKGAKAGILGAGVAGGFLGNFIGTLAIGFKKFSAEDMLVINGAMRTKGIIKMGLKRKNLKLIQELKDLFSPEGKKILKKCKGIEIGATIAGAALVGGATFAILKHNKNKENKEI